MDRTEGIDRTQIFEALRNVTDPCSEFNRTPLNIVEMGLIDDVSVVDRAVNVTLLLTEPACIFFFDMAVRIEEEVGALCGVSAVNVRARSDALWNADRMDDGARQRLEARRHGRFVQLGLKPPRRIAEPQRRVE